MSSGRFPVEVKAVGLLKHGKRKTYMLSVSWSDQNNVLIYREFEEFKKLHKELKRKFPIESGLLKKSDRTIPKFRDTNQMLRNNQNLSSCMERLQLLEIYCQELLKAEAKISLGEDAIHFFEAQSRDLDPSFPENSVIILPSATTEARKQEAAEPSSPTITQPVVSQSYRCVEAFETKDTKNRPFKACRGETLEVLMKDRTGWWLVENDGKQIAWFPAPYLEEGEEEEEAPFSRETSREELLHYVTRPYTAKAADELSVNAGVVVEVLEKSANGWWLVWYHRNAGYVPSVFLRPYKNPHSKFLALARSNLHLSTPNLSETSRPAHKERSSGDAPEASSPNGTWEGQAALPGRTRAQSLTGERGAASSGLATEAGSSSDRSGNVSDQGCSCCPKEPASHLLRARLQLAAGSQASLSPSPESKQRSDSGFDEEASDSTDSEAAPCGPTVPPRPSPHEILQRCSTVTKRALQGARPRPGLPAHCGSRP